MNPDHTLREIFGGARRDDAPRIGLGEDALFDLLSDRRRRLAIDYLADHGSTPWHELATEIAAAETHMRPDQVPRRRIEPVEDDLRNEQLPRLVEAGVIRWVDGDEEVRAGHSVEGIARLLREVDRRTQRDVSTGTSFGAGGSWAGSGPQRNRSPRRNHP